MADSTETEAIRVISRIGKQLGAYKTCPNKDTLVNLLKQANRAFAGLKQSESLKSVIKPLSSSLVKHSLLLHKDKDIRLLVGICFCEIIRVLAPDPEFTDAVSRQDIFRLLVNIFAELDDTKNPYFSLRVQLLETVAKLRFCLIMLDIGCEDLVKKLFKNFFTVLREHHPPSMVSAVVSIMSQILEEKMKEKMQEKERSSSELLTFEKKVSEPLLDVVLQNLLKEAKGASRASHQLAVSVIEKCSEKIEDIVSGFLRSCILNRDAVQSEIKEYYHDIIYEIFQCAPQMLLSVIPSLMNELLTDQVDVRIKALGLMKRIFSLPGNHFAQDYHQLFVEFLNRSCDKSAEVRLITLSCAKAFYMTNPSAKESLKVLAALQDRLLDSDDRVRSEAVTVMCDLARHKLKSNTHELITLVAERLRDKKVSVRKKALKKLLELYQEYCTQCAAAIMDFNAHFEQIPCKILMLCYDRDCKEFKPQRMEIVLADSLFPGSLSVEDRTRHWVFMFSLFTPCHLKALNAILSQKLRLRNELQVYLTLCNKDKEEVSEEVEKKMKMSIVKMSASFEDTTKAQDCFRKLDMVKNSRIFNLLGKLLNEQKTEDAQTTRDNLLREIGDKNPHAEFLQLLSMKCSFNLFGSEHVCCILRHLADDRFRNKHLEDSSVQLLLTILSAFPSLLRGLETEFQLLLSKEIIPFNERLIQILAKEGSHMLINLGDIYPFLEKVCLEGRRVQSKLAVSAIAALMSPSEQSLSKELCKKLVDSLHLGKQLPTVLQSLGCLAQHSVLAFQVHEEVVTRYIIEEIFQLNYGAMLEDPNLLENASSECSVSCQLKIFGLKTLVRSFLPHQSAAVSRPINFLLDIILEMLQKGDFYGGSISSDSDKTHIRLAAAKSVLQLSRRWDSLISPQLFRCTVLTAKDNSPLVQRLFVKKVQKLLREHKIPCRYACAFPFAATDSPEDLQQISLKYMEEFVQEYGNTARINQISTMPGHVTGLPVYVVVFLIHILAHDPNFPTADHHDANFCVQFFSPLVFSLQALVDFNCSDGTVDLISKAISYLRSIFHAIKKAEDAVDAQITPKLHVLSDIGISLLDAIGNTRVSRSHIPGLILLPSSLYKVGQKHISQGNSDLLIRYHQDESFIRKLLDSSKNKAQTAGSINAPNQKCQDGMTRSGNSGGSKLEMQFCKKGPLPLSIIKEKYSDKEELSETSNQELDTRERQKTSEPCSASASFELHKEFSIDDEHEDDAHGAIEAVIRTEHLPYHSRTRSSRPLSDKKDEHPCSLKEKETISRCQTIMRERSKSVKGNSSDIPISKESKNKGEKLIRQQIELCSSEDKCCSEAFDSSDNTLKITYDSREAEVVSLDSEILGTLSSHSLLDQDSCGLQSRCWKSSDMIGYVSQQEADLSKDEATFGSKKTALAEIKKRGSVLVDSSLSEVINVNEDPIARRTRSRRG
ncbi:sister chromatid cohesion protein PDS5 homolog B isoform X3 [Nicotiana sylvestris]|uniref:Sister chromatid cohesion protein PDS5 homolog A isoform X3 n=1 Tax=Nicotiana sylvestris TaxID=4096 RepID=A0A1U7V912_NICSY|nr:PREDICTED: sister chromatid cohesion protein PDS5 homolog A isoform X3 [Nicotiana sylvestris]